MCQLDWTTGYWDIWLSIILGMSAKMFLDQISTLMGRVKQTALHNVPGNHTIYWGSEQNKKLLSRPAKGSDDS